MKKYLITIITLAAIACCFHTASAFEMEGIDIHGFISQGYLKSTDYNYLAHDSEEGSFSYNEMGINFSKGLTDKLRIGVQLFARDLGDIANNKITVDWAYGDYRWRDWLGLRIGKIKLPYGVFNETRDMDMLRTFIILPQGIYNDLLRDTFIAVKGGGIYGNIPLGETNSIDYQALVGSIESDLDSGSAKYIVDEIRDFLTIDGLDIKTSYAGALKWNTFVDGLSLSVTKLKFEPEIPVTYTLPGISGITETWHVKQDDTVLSLEYTWNDLYLVTEYAIKERKVAPVLISGASKDELESYYFMASYRFTDKLEVGAYYSEFYPNKNNKSDYTRWQKDTAISLRYDVNDNWIIKVEGHLIDGVADVVLVDNPIMEEKDWKMFATKMTYSF